MGSFGTGFLSAVGSAAKQKTDQIHADEQAQKDANAKFYWTAIENAEKNGSLTPEMHQWAMDGVKKAYGNSKPMKELWGKIQHITGQAMGHPAWGMGAPNPLKGDAGLPGSQNGGNASTGATPAPAAAAGQVSAPGLPAFPTTTPSTGGATPQPKTADGGGPIPATPDAAPGPVAPSAAPPQQAGVPWNAPSWLDPATGGDQKKNGLAPEAGATAAPDGIPSGDASAHDPANASSTPAASGGDALQASLNRPGAPPAPPLPPAPTPLPAAQLPASVPPPPGKMSTNFAAMSPDEKEAYFLSQAYPSQEAQEARQLEYYRKQQEIMHANKMAEAQASLLAKDQTARNVFGPTTSVRNARLLAGQGHTYPDADGNPIDLTTLPDEMGLKYVARGSKHWYEPFSPNQKQITVGNEVYTINPGDVDQLSSGAGTALGQKSVGSTRSRQVELANGQVGSLSSSSTPAAPGIAQRGGMPAPGQSIAHPNPPSAGSTAQRFAAGAPVTTEKGRIPPPPTGGQPPATAPTPSAKPAKAPKEMALTQAAYNQERQIITPVREAATQMFGDPTSGLKGLASYGPLYDNPQARRRVATALALTFGGDPKEATSEGGLYSIMKNYAGVPRDLAASQVAAKSSALEKLTPQEKDWYDALISTYGAAVGLRSLTKASGAMSSVKRIEQELPLPDISTQSAASFYNRMANLSEMVYNGTRTLSNQVMPQDEKERYHAYVKEYLDRKEKLRNPGNKALTPPPGSPAAVKTADDFLNKYRPPTGAN